MSIEAGATPMRADLVVKGDELYISATDARWYYIDTKNEISEGNHKVLRVEPATSHTRRIIFEDGDHFEVSNGENVWVSRFGGGI